MTTKITEMYLNHWFSSCPKVLKVCMSNWTAMTYDQKLYTYLNPSPEFIAANRKFEQEYEHYNY